MEKRKSAETEKRRERNEDGIEKKVRFKKSKGKYK
jgi:hypothetical protein